MANLNQILQQNQTPEQLKKVQQRAKKERDQATIKAQEAALKLHEFATEHAKRHGVASASERDWKIAQQNNYPVHASGRFAIQRTYYFHNQQAQLHAKTLAKNLRLATNQAKTALMDVRQLGSQIIGAHLVSQFKQTSPVTIDSPLSELVDREKALTQEIRRIYHTLASRVFHLSNIDDQYVSGPSTTTANHKVFRTEKFRAELMKALRSIETLHYFGALWKTRLSGYTPHTIRTDENTKTHNRVKNQITHVQQVAQHLMDLWGEYNVIKDLVVMKKAAAVSSFTDK